MNPLTQVFVRPINRWWTVLAGALGCAAGGGIIASYAFGLFIKAVAEDFGWGRTETTASISCFYIASGIGCLLYGSMISRWPLRLSTIVFVALFALCMASVALLPPSVLAFCAVFSLMGIFAAATTPMPYVVAISGWFDKNRGRALALAIAATGLSAMFLPSFAGWLLERYGWRGGYMGLALFCGGVSLFGLAFLFRTPPAPRQSADPGPGLMDLVRGNPDFWKIAGPILMISVAVFGAITHLGAILTDDGMTLAQAARMIALVGIASWVVRVALMFLLDHVHVRFLATTLFLMAGVGTLLLAFDIGGNTTIVALLALGLASGAEADLVSYTASRYFPAAGLGRALGAIWICWAWGSALGVFIGSLSFDMTGSYRYALLLFAALAILSAAIFSRLGPYRYAAAH